MGQSTAGRLPGEGRPRGSAHALPGDSGPQSGGGRRAEPWLRPLQAIGTCTWRERRRPPSSSTWPLVTSVVRCVPCGRRRRPSLHLGPGGASPAWLLRPCRGGGTPGVGSRALPEGPWPPARPSPELPLRPRVPTPPERASWRFPWLQSPGVPGPVSGPRQAHPGPLRGPVINRLSPAELRGPRAEPPAGLGSAGLPALRRLSSVRPFVCLSCVCRSPRPLSPAVHASRPPLCLFGLAVGSLCPPSAFRSTAPLGARRYPAPGRAACRPPCMLRPPLSVPDSWPRRGDCQLMCHGAGCGSGGSGALGPSSAAEHLGSRSRPPARPPACPLPAPVSGVQWQALPAPRAPPRSAPSCVLTLSVSFTPSARCGGPRGQQLGT